MVIFNSLLFYFLLLLYSKASLHSNAIVAFLYTLLYIHYIVYIELSMFLPDIELNMRFGIILLRFSNRTLIDLSKIRLPK